VESVVKLPDWTDANETWHPTVAHGAYDHYFGARQAATSVANVKRQIFAGLTAAYTLAIPGVTEASGLTDSARTVRESHTPIYSPDYGETAQVFDFIGDRCIDISTALEIPNSLDRSRSTLDRFTNEVLAWHSQLNANHISGLNKRLAYLFEDEPEPSKGQALPDINSFGVLLAFLARYSEVKTPSLGYNRDGVFSATWVGDQKLRMTLDFMSSSSIRWIFVDSRDGIKKAVTGAGIVTLDILAGVLVAYGALDWMKS
jgi:hypothetical protein